MKTKFIKNLIPLVLLIAFVATFSSCNRGMGCPNNFSVETTTKVIHAIPGIIANR